MVLVDSEAQTDECEVLLGELEGESGGGGLQRWSRRTSFRGRDKKEAWMRRSIRRCLCLLVLVTLLGGAGIIYFGFYCPEAVCALSSTAPRSRYKVGYLKDGINQFHMATDQIGRPLSDALRSSTGLSFEEVTAHDFQFNIRGHDVIVFLHIQKTGGTTFGRHLVSDLDLDKSCQCHRKIKKRCTCLRPGKNSNETWLFSRYSTGWKCGLHADWTELTSCVDDMMDRIEDHDVKRR